MPQKRSATGQRDRDRARAARLLKPHAPRDWEERFRKTELLDSIIDGEPIQMFVMAADIRESTTLMKEAVRFERFALVMDKFVTSVRRGITRSGGWFDKFTGDGFLAYWIVQPASPKEYEERFVQTAGDIAHTAHSLVDLFHRRVMEDFRDNSRNLSSGVGLSMGLDAGPGYLVQIADELTVVGSPVVGAVRMVTAAACLPRGASSRWTGRGLRGVGGNGHSRVPPDQGVPEGPRGLRPHVRSARCRSCAWRRRARVVSSFDLPGVRCNGWQTSQRETRSRGLSRWYERPTVSVCRSS
jgi:class 3 adenylate cyclase